MQGSGNIILIGMPGSGKSTLGVVLAKMLGMRFVDLDLVIQEREGETLQETIDGRGVDEFLRIENEVLAGFDCSGTVVATGGSAVYAEEGMANLRSGGEVVYLRVTLEELAERLGELDERGVVFREGTGGSLADLYDERLPLYERYADITIDVTGNTIRENAVALKNLLAQK